MDLSNFFNFFNSENPKEEDLRENLDTFKKTPYFKLGMFHKLIFNGLTFKKSLLHFFSKADQEINMDSVDSTSEFIMHQRAWFWISQFDWNEEEWLSDLEKISNDEFLISLKLAIKYFEELEDYEKCAFIKKIQDLVQKYLASQEE